MARPSLALGARGVITTTPLPEGGWVARCRFRDYDGVVSRPQARGETQRAAEEALEELLGNRRRSGQGVPLSTDMTIAELADVWLAQHSAVRPQSVDRYRSAIKAQIKPRLGHVKVREATTPMIGRVLADIRSEGLDPKRIRTVLSLMFGYLASNGVLEVNPVKNVSQFRASDLERIARQPKAITDPADIGAIFNILDEAYHRQLAGPGTNPTRDLYDFALLLVATGCRPGEAAALRWFDIDLNSDTPSLTIRGTIVLVSGQPLIRQPLTKTVSGLRRLYLPPEAVAMLRRRKATQEASGRPNPEMAVFPTRVGTWPSLNNLGSRFRKAKKGTAYEWVTFVTLRKTLATAIDRELGSQAAADQLGHSDDDITLEHYIQPSGTGPQAAGTIASTLLSKSVLLD